MTNNKSKETRIEKDTMGEMQVPINALYGASTQRAFLNFPISDLKFSKEFISGLGAIKWAASKANQELKLISKEKAETIQKASEEVIDGTLYEHFVLDIFQTGSGTSTNMNANEVIATRASEIMGWKNEGKKPIHPNDDVNMCQSSNDVIPTAIHISSYLSIQNKLSPALNRLEKSLRSKAEEFKGVIKSGRTHLQDATPVTLGQEFLGYAVQVKNCHERIKRSLITLRELALGGTATGTGINTHPEFAKLAIKFLNQKFNTDFIEAPDHFEAQGSRDAVVELSGQLKTFAVSLMKIANDLRWLASGPRCGIGEIFLPEIQPGSSIMPAKVNPVICESVMMVCAHVMGSDTAIMISGQHGNFELNVMLPVIAYNLLQQIDLLASVSNNFCAKCIDGIEANVEKCLENAEKSLQSVTALAPKIGYDNAALLAKRALKEDKTVREVAREMKVLAEEELNKTLDFFAMTKPGL